MEDVSYSAGSIVWVKLSGGKWWPGEVVAPDTYPEEVTQGLRKSPLAVVKFFDEDYYEIVKSNNHIHPFVCARKDEFIKKGRELLKLDPNAEKFDKDVSEAKRVCGITNEDKAVYTNSHESTPLSNHFEAVLPKSKHPYGSAMVTSSASQPKSLNSRIQSYGDYKTIEFDSGTDVRIRTQPSPISTPKGAAYACDMCSFQTNRIANIIVHHKSHSEQFKQMSYKPSLVRERGAFSDDGLPRSKDSHLPLLKVKRKLLADDSKAKKVKGKNNEKPKTKRKPKIDSSDKNTSSNSGTDFVESQKKRVLPIINQDGSPVAPKRRRKKEPDADSIFDKIKKQAMKKMNRKHVNACILSSPASLKRLSKRKDGSDGSSDEEEFLISRGVYNDDEEVTPVKNNENIEAEQSPDKVDADIEPKAVEEDIQQNDNINNARLDIANASLDTIEMLPVDAIVEHAVPIEGPPSSPMFVRTNDVPNDDDDSPLHSLHFAKQVRKDYSRVSRKANLRNKEMQAEVFIKSREAAIESDEKQSEWAISEKVEERVGNVEESILEQMEKAIANVRKIKEIEDIRLEEDDSEKEDDALVEEQQSDKEEELFEAEESTRQFIDSYEKLPEKTEEQEEMDTSKASVMSEELFSDEIIMERAEELIADDIIEKAEELIMRDGIMEREENKTEEIMAKSKEDTDEETEGDIVNDTLEDDSNSKLGDIVVDDADDADDDDADADADDDDADDDDAAAAAADDDDDDDDDVVAAAAAAATATATATATTTTTTTATTTTTGEVIVDETPVELDDFIPEEKSALNGSPDECTVVDTVIEEIVHEVSTGEPCVIEESTEETISVHNAIGLESETETFITTEGMGTKLDVEPSIKNVIEDSLSETDVLADADKNDSAEEAIVVDDFIESSEIVAASEDAIDATQVAPPVEEIAVVSRVESEELEPQIEMELETETEFLEPQTEVELEPMVPQTEIGPLLTRSEPKPPVPQTEIEPLVSHTEAEPAVPHIEFETFVPQAAPELMVPGTEVNNESEQTFAQLPDHHLEEEGELVTLDAETGLLSVQGGSDISCDEASELPRPPPHATTMSHGSPHNSVAVPEPCPPVCDPTPQLQAPVEEVAAEYLEYTKLQTLVQSPELETVYLESEMEVPMLEGGEIIHIDNEQVIDTSMDVFCNEIVIESEDKDMVEEYEGICLVPEEDKILLESSEAVIQKSDDIGRLPAEAVNGAMIEDGEHQSAVIGQAR